MFYLFIIFFISLWHISTGSVAAVSEGLSEDFPMLRSLQRYNPCCEISAKKTCLPLICSICHLKCSVNGLKKEECIKENKFIANSVAKFTTCTHSWKLVRVASHLFVHHKFSSVSITPFQSETELPELSKDWGPWGDKQPDSLPMNMPRKATHSFIFLTFLFCFQLSGSFVSR